MKQFKNQISVYLNPRAVIRNFRCSSHTTLFYAAQIAKLMRSPAADIVHRLLFWRCNQVVLVNDLAVAGGGNLKKYINSKRFKQRGSKKEEKPQKNEKCVVMHDKCSELAWYVASQAASEVR